MTAREFGLRVDHEMRERQIGASKLAARVGELPDGRVLDATGVRLIRQGRREKYDTELVVRIARAIGLPEDEACHIAGVEQPDFDLEDYRHYRRYRHRLAVVGASSDQPRPKSGRSWRPADRRFAPDRRRRDRRGLRILPAA